MRIESLAVRNFRALRDVRLHRVPQMSVFVGANGSGKSTLFDVFGFLRDSLVHNVRQALAKRVPASRSLAKRLPGRLVLGLALWLGSFAPI